MANRAWLAVALLLATLIVFSAPAPPGQAAPGDLDQSLAATGQVVTDMTGHFSEIRAVALQPDGKIVVVGPLAPHAADEASDFAVARYTVTGVLDGSFGTGGVAITDFNGNLDEANAVALQPDGKIVVVGTSAGLGPEPGSAAARYNPNGTLDASFGDRGTAVDMSFDNEARSVALQPDGKIVIGGRSGGSFVVERRLPDGSLDEDFGEFGRAYPGVYGGTDAGNGVTSIAVQPDGKIVGVGPADGDITGFRLLPNGDNDELFGADGVFDTDIAESDDAARAMALRPDGRIVVAGRSDDDVAVLRYLPDGTLDPSFDEDGYLVTDLPTEGSDEARSVLALPGDGVLVGGAAGADFALLRYQPNGAPDTRFDGDGLVTTDFARGADVATAMALLPGGRVIAAGAAETRLGTDLAIARYGVNGALDGAFGTSGTVTTDLASTSDRADALAIAPDGSLVAAGSAAAGRGWDFALSRHRSDGSLDGSFGVGGRVTTDFGVTVGSGDDRAHGVALVPDDHRIVLAGESAGGQESLFAVARYDGRTGQLDSDFGTDGKVALDLEEGDGGQGALAVAVQPNGRTVAAGYVDDAFVVVRLDWLGELDSTFANDGIVTPPLFANDSVARAVAVQPDGKIVVAGDMFPEAPTMTMGRSAGAGAQFFGRHIVVARFLPDGTLDETFGEDGLVFAYPTFFGHDEARALALQPDGKIVVTGASYGWAGGVGAAAVGDTGDFVVLRFNPDGSPDPTFGFGEAAGMVFTDIDDGRDAASAVGILPDGKIAVAGVADADTTGGADRTDDFAVVRYMPNGALDTSFDGDGIALTDFGGNDDARGLVVQGDGAIVTAGTAVGRARTPFALTRYGGNGAPDASFGTGGRVTTVITGDVDEARAVAVQPDGNIVAAGEARAGPAGDIAVARYRPDGSLDPTFGFGGRVVTDVSGGADGAYAVALQPDGKIVVAGWAFGPSAGRFVVVRYHPDGVRDESFNGSGLNTFGVSDRGRAQARAVVLQPDGRIVLVGFVRRPGGVEVPPLHHFMVVRVNADGSLDPSYGRNDVSEPDGIGIVDVGPGGGDEAYAAALQPDGKVVAAGRTISDNGGLVALARFNTDGSLDGTFSGGTVTSFIGGSAHVTSVTLQRDGRIVVAGPVDRSRTNRDAGVVRYRADGVLDGTFGTGGVAFADAGPADHAGAVAVLPDGDLLVAGHGARGAFTDVALFRLRSTGRVDERFADRGVAFAGLTGFSDEGAAVAVQPNGRVVVAGRAVLGDIDADFTVLRFVGGPLGGGVPRADLAVTLAESADPANLTAPFRYVLGVRNLGPTGATDVVATAELPPAVTLLTSIPSQGTPCLFFAPRLACALGTVPAGGTAAVTLIVQPTQPGTVTSTARVSGGQPDPNPANDTAAATTAVQPPTVRVNPAVVTPSRVVSVIGTGYQPGVTVAIGYLGFDHQRTATPGGDGSFAVPFVVFPNTTPGIRTMEIRTLAAAPQVLATTKLLIVPDTLAPPGFVARS